MNSGIFPKPLNKPPIRRRFEVKEMAEAAHAVGAKVLLDACQSVPHLKIDAGTKSFSARRRAKQVKTTNIQ